MTEENSWYSQLETRASIEAAIIVDAFRKRRIEIGGFPDPADQDDDVHPDGIAFMYAKGHLLTRDRYLGGVGGIQGVQPVQSANNQRGVLDILPEHGVTDIEVRRIVRDIVLLRLNPNRNKDTTESSQSSQGNGGNSEGDRRTDEDEPPDVLDIVDSIDEELGVGVATPDHVLTAAQVLHPCSATEPEQVYPTAGPSPAVCRDGGARVRIFVADTGLVANAPDTFPWLNGVHGAVDSRSTGGVIQPYGGHGTFVAGVLRSIAPETRVHVANVFDTAGSALDSEVATRLNAAFSFGFEILHLTASCMTKNNIPPPALEAWLELLSPYKGVICVAPAGNNPTRRPSWPGAFPHVISVGALATDWHRRADFSNYGGWVDVYAPGQKLINAFGSGTYHCMFPPDVGQVRTFSGLAQLSGTSFSAPIVTGLIAARMARRGESAQEAAAALLAEARARTIPGVGPVLLPRCNDDDDDGFGDDCGHGRHGRRRCGCGHCD